MTRSDLEAGRRAPGMVESFSGAEESYVLMGSETLRVYRAAALITPGVRINPIVGSETEFIGKDGITRRTRPGQHLIGLTIMPKQKEAFKEMVRVIREQQTTRKPQQQRA